MERGALPLHFQSILAACTVKSRVFTKHSDVKTLPLSDLRPEIPQDFRRSAAPIKKVLFIFFIQTPILPPTLQSVRAA